MTPNELNHIHTMIALQSIDSSQSLKTTACREISDIGKRKPKCGIDLRPLTNVKHQENNNKLETFSKY